MSVSTAAPAVLEPKSDAGAVRTPWGLLMLIGLGGLFNGVTGPLLSAFIPPLVQDVLGDRRTAIGGVMAIDNVLLLVLVPLAGAASDRSLGRFGRLPLVVAGLILASLGMVVMPWAGESGLAGLVAALVVLHTGTNLPRAPFQALLADAVPSRFRSLAAGSATFQMCVGAIAFLMLGQVFGMRLAFVAAALTVLAIDVAIVAGLRDRTAPSSSDDDSSFQALFAAVRAAMAGAVPGLRTIFVVSFLLQLTFQTFTTWYALHGSERFGLSPQDVTIGLIAWAVGGVVGALPGGALGVRLGRRATMLLGFALMVVALLVLDRVGSATVAAPLLALASAFWTFPMANAFPLFVEPIPRRHRGVLSALFLLSIALGGAIGDPLNGSLFDLFGGYRRLFQLMAVYTSFAFVALLFLPAGSGEASREGASPQRRSRRQRPRMRRYW